ncbi:MAG: cupin domain-containing protein [Chloroflexi bacterium]|nr:cupin domain-containing protein [Chloroflexota bacterium]
MVEKRLPARPRVSRTMRVRHGPAEDNAPMPAKATCSHKVNVGPTLRTLRAKRGLSIRELAEKSGLAVNTLSLIENDKSSPSVATLQQLAVALEVPITSFFANGSPKSRVVYIKACQRVGAAFAHGALEDLGAGMPDNVVEPFVVTMNPNANSGTQPIVHTGHEFVFCLEGRIVYTVDDQTYLLEPEDSLLFESHLPHRWQNVEAAPARAILILCPSDSRDQPTQRHFIPEPFSAK